MNLSPELRRWRGSIFVLFFVQGAVSATWLARLPALRDDTGVSVSQTGSLFVAGSVGAIIGLASTPVLVARLGAHRSLILTVAVGLSGVLAMGMGSSLLASAAVVALGLFGFGLGFGATGVLNNIEGAVAERAIGKTQLPLMHAFFSIGTMSGALLATAFAHFGVSVAEHFATVVAVGAVLAGWALRLLPDRRETSDDAPQLSKEAWHKRLRSSMAVWRAPLVLLLALSLLGTAFSEGAANDWIAIGMVDGHGHSNAVGALAYGLFVAGMTIIRLTGGPLTDRFGRVVMYRASVATIALGIVLFVFGPGLVTSLVAALLWGLGIGLTFPTLMSAAAIGENGAARVAAVSSVGYASGLIGPPVLGWLGGLIGVLPAMLALLPLLAMSFVLGRSASGIAAPRRLEPSLTAR